MDQQKKSLFFSHLAVLIFGLSGVFGKLIRYPSVVITFGKVLFSSTALLLIQLLLKKRIRLAEKKHYFYLISLGMLLALHWCCFYQAIQLSTVALGLLSFSTYPVFVTFLEPILCKGKLRLEDIAVAIVVFLGIALVVPSFEIGNSTTKGILIGIFSGFTYAILSIFNKTLTKTYEGITIAFYEQSTACLTLLPFMFIYQPTLTVRDILLVAVLGVVLTAFAHTLFIGSLKYIRTQTASIITCLEPIYSIIFAFLLLGEVPSSRDILGGVVVLGTVAYSTLRGLKKSEVTTYGGDKESFAEQKSL